MKQMELRVCERVCEEVCEETGFAGYCGQPNSALGLVAHAGMSTAINRALIRGAAVPVVTVGSRGAGCERYTGARPTARTRMAVGLITLGIHERLTSERAGAFSFEPREIHTGCVRALTAGMSVV